MKKISIITSVLNSGEYLRECLESVMFQTYPNIEHILIDGGSTDNTLEIIAEYAKRFPGRIRYISEPDHGPCDAWNKGLRMATGDVIAWLGSDDLYFHHTVEIVMNYFENNPEWCFLFGECLLIDAQEKEIGLFGVVDFNLNRVLNIRNGIATPSAFYRKEVIDKVGDMDTSIHSCDYDYWIRTSKFFKMHKVNELLSKFRIHRNSVSGSLGAQRIYAQEALLLNRRYGGNLFSLCLLRYILYTITPLFLHKWLTILLKKLYNVIMGISSGRLKAKR